MSVASGPEHIHVSTDMHLAGITMLMIYHDDTAGDGGLQGVLQDCSLVGLGSLVGLQG